MGGVPDAEAKLDDIGTKLALVAQELKHLNKAARQTAKADERREMRAYRMQVFLIAVICLFAGLNLKDVVGLAGAVAIAGPVAGGGALFSIWPTLRSGAADGQA